jgi:5'-3' exonuclease
MGRFSNSKAVIVDLSYQLHRGLRVEDIWNLKSEVDGEVIRTGGIMTVFRILGVVMDKYPGYVPVLCSDKGLCARRLAVHPNYKNTVDKKVQDSKAPEELSAEELEERAKSQEYRQAYHRSKKEIKYICEKLGIPYLEYDGVEGDDIMAVVAMAEYKESVVVTDDRDLIQLVGLSTADHNIINFRAMKNEIISYDKFVEEFETVDNFVLHKSLTGDGSDNIPQIASKVGGSTAMKFIKAWRSAGLSNDDIVNSKYELLEGEVGGGEIWSGRGKSKVLLEDKTPKYNHEALKVIHADGGHKQTHQSMINVMLKGVDQLKINLELIDLRKIDKSLFDMVSSDHERQVDIFRDKQTSMFDAISLFNGRYKIIDLDVLGLFNKLNVARKLI